MTWFWITVVGLFIIGSAIAIYEWRRGRPFTIERIDEEVESHEAREQIRFEDEIRNRTYLDLSR